MSVERLFAFEAHLTRLAVFVLVLLGLDKFPLV
jgi:hypothetical protein